MQRPPGEWTLGQRRRIIRRVVRGKSQLVPVEEGDDDSDQLFRKARARLQQAPGSDEAAAGQGGGEQELLNSQEKSVAGNKDRRFACAVRWGTFESIGLRVVDDSRLHF